LVDGSVIWIDNHADLLEPFAKQLLDRGFPTELYANPDIALAKLLDSSRCYDGIVLDLRFADLAGNVPGNSSIRNGFDFLEQLSAHKIDKPVCILSSFLQLSEYKDRLTSYGARNSIRAVAIDKYVDDVDTDAFKHNFLDKIIVFLNDARLDKIAPGVKTDSGRMPAEINPMEFNYDSFLALTKNEQDEVRFAANQILSDRVLEMEKDGLKWVLFLGSIDQPFAVARISSEVWTTDQVSDLATKHNRVPFQYYLNSLVEDQWGHCGADLEQASYPKVKFTMQNTKPAWIVHFDTGSYDNYFSLEEMVGAGYYKDYSNLICGSYRGRPYYFRREKLPIKVHNGVGGETIVVSSYFKLIERWEQSKFVAECHKVCEKGRVTSLGSRQCVNRCGLLGRSLLVDGDLVLDRYDPQNPVISFSGRK
jgi:hypothetical protein